MQIEKLRDRRSSLEGADAFCCLGGKPAVAGDVRDIRDLKDIRDIRDVVYWRKWV